MDAGMTSKLPLWANICTVRECVVDWYNGLSYVENMVLVSPRLLKSMNSHTIMQSCRCAATQGTDEDGYGMT